MTELSRGKRLSLFGTRGLMFAAVLVRFGVVGGDQSSVVASRDSIPVAKQRLEILRRKAATVPAKEEILKRVTAELQEREKGIVQAGSSEQARAHLMDVLRNAATANHFTVNGATQLPSRNRWAHTTGRLR